MTAIIVSDDSSNDNGLDIVSQLAAQDPRIRVVRSPHNTPSGPSPTRNRGISHCTSEFVAFLDGDDWWDQDKLNQQLPFFDAPAIGLVHCASRSVDQDGQLLGEQLAPPTPSDQKQLFDVVRLGIYPVTGSASGVVMRRRLLDNIGMFPEHLRFGEDWDLWARAAQQCLFACPPKPLTNIRVLGTFARTLSAEDEYHLWLRVFERWQDDHAFMRQASAVSRSRAVSPLLEIFWQRRYVYLLFGFAQTLKQRGGPLGRSTYRAMPHYWLNLGRLLPHLARASIRSIARRLK